jgi:hypothetical protein
MTKEEIAAIRARAVREREHRGEHITWLLILGEMDAGEVVECASSRAAAAQSRRAGGPCPPRAWRQGRSSKSTLPRGPRAA